ncbi:phosphopantetheine-binding protein [Chitinophaga sp. OAE865]
MGLDSVELLVTFEKHFGIGIPDAEAETIFTVQDMTDVIAKHLAIT